MDRITKLLFVISIFDLVIAIVLSILVLNLMARTDSIEYIGCYNSVEAGIASDYCKQVVKEGMP